MRSAEVDSLVLTRSIADQLEADGLTWGQVMVGEKLNLHPLVVAVVNELARRGFVVVEPISEVPSD